MHVSTPEFSGEHVGAALERALDADQQHLVDRLDLVRTAMISGDASTEAPRGLYVHGSVGRGKTWLCDAFFASVPTAAKRRIHLHDLLHDLHRAMWQARSALTRPATIRPVESTSPDAHSAAESAVGSAAAPTRDVTQTAIGTLLGDVELLYVDEFQVHDAADAVLLCRVLQAVFDRGILLVITSNDAPTDLLADSEFYPLIEPAIDAIETHLDVVELGGTRDYRRVDTPGRAQRGSGFASGLWISEAELDDLSPGVLRRPTVVEHTVLLTNGHEFPARRAADGVVWFHFDDLCEGNTALADYVVWSREFHTWVVEGLPPLNAATPQARQRFAHIVDVLVDRDVTLHVISDSSRNDFSLDAGPRDAERLHSRLALLRSR